MAMSRTGRNARVTVFAPRIDALLREHRGADLFRLEEDTVGVAGVDLMDRLLRSRPANAEERPTFKPVQGRQVTRTDASALMQAVSADVRAALRKPLGRPDLTGKWPHVAHVYLRDLVFGRESFRFRILVDRRLELTPKLTWMAVAAGTAMLGKPGAGIPLSQLAARALNAENYQDRRFAMYLYRRVAAPVCSTVSALATNALWLGAPFDEGVSNRDILLEALRLLPPSWNLLRMASPEYPAVDGRIGRADDILMFPLLSHRDPRLWDDPEAFRPERWKDLDPDDQPGYLPFGHADERCWGRHMVMPLAERLLDLVRRDGLVVSPEQTVGRVELDGLLEVAGVRMVRG
ncbi:cytochrome P450 [Kitasatospora sp. NPDC047058]|uniref:cytochrome P450 n=1 Tax=Kitasatospora sp. NPDC047058 TaxID=3155620 RepID=UPI0033CCCE91